MESIEAFLRAIKMYVAIGLVVTAIHAVFIQAPTGDTRWQRAVTVFWQVAWWPRLFVGAEKTTDMIADERRPFPSSLRSGPQASERRTAMSLAQRVKAALDRQGVPQTAVDRDGYHVEEMIGDLAIVRWGRGEPFRSLKLAPNGPELTSCMTALKRESFLVAPNGFEDANGPFIAVRESSP